jgi:hypothetical protein
MKNINNYLVVLCALAAAAILAAAAAGPSAADSMNLGIFVYENLEGYHTPSSTFGTYLGSKLMPVCKTIKVEHRVPLQTNETIRILDEETEDRKIVWTTLDAFFNNGTIDYPAVTFADDDIKFRDLTWKVDEETAVKWAREAGMTHCLMGTCTGYVTIPSKKTEVGQRGLKVVTASVNIQLYNLKTGETEWMQNYRQVVSHMDNRIAFEQGAEMVADRIAKDLSIFMDDIYGTGTR